MKKFLFSIIAGLILVASTVAFVIHLLPVSAIPIAATLALVTLMVEVPDFGRSLQRSQIMPAMIISVLTGVLLSVVLGVYAWPAAGILFLISLRPGRSPDLHGAIRLRSGVLIEVWLGELIVPFRAMAPWLNEVPDYSGDVQNGTVIHLTDVGADPAVLINNTTYPINTAGRTDTDVPIGLDLFDTENTSVRDTELYGLKYDKIRSVTEQHGNALAEKQGEKAAHAFAPTDDSVADTPLFKTTGSARATATSRKVLKLADLITIQNFLDKAKVSAVGRILVLHPDHLADILIESVPLNQQYVNLPQGTALNFSGFKIYSYPTTPMYDNTFTKKAFGAAAAPTTDHIASFFFFAPRMFRASGEKKMYYSEAAVDPANRQTVVGFSQRFIALPKTAKAYGVIVDGDVTP